MKVPSPNTARRRLLTQWFLRGGATFLGATWAYAGLWEPNAPVIEKVTLPIPGLPPAFDGIRIAFISDIHLQPNFGPERLAPTLALIGNAKPDLILLGGDYCNDSVGEREYWLEMCANAFQELAAPLGVFAVFGNHDYPIPPFDPPRRPWQEAGITPLHDEAVALTRSGERLFLVGFRSTLVRQSRVQEVMATLPRFSTRIVVQHEPSYIPQNAVYGANLMLSGHTHGGQILIPFVGPLRMPSQANGYLSGLYWYEKPRMPLYVTRGIGVLPPLLRFRCLPEVSLITLRVGLPGQLR